MALQGWSNVVGVLTGANLTVSDLIKVTASLTNAADYPVYAKVRGAYLGGHKPTSTLLVVAALALPAWKFEIEGVAVTAK